MDVSHGQFGLVFSVAMVIEGKEIYIMLTLTFLKVQLVVHTHLGIRVAVVMFVDEIWCGLCCSSASKRLNCFNTENPVVWGRRGTDNYLVSGVVVCHCTLVTRPLLLLSTTGLSGQDLNNHNLL